MSSTTLVGLDVGSSSVRAVEATVSRDADRPTIGNFGQLRLPPGAVVGGVVKDDKTVSAALRQLWAARAFASKDVVLGVSHQQVIVRELEVTNLPPDELRRALPFLVRDALPLPVDQALLDFHPLEQAGRGETVRGLVIAAPKEPVVGTVRAVENAGLRVAQVDLACFAALRAAAHLAGATETLIDMGATGTNIVVHTDGTPQVVRTVPRGGADITKLLAARLDVSAERAEQLKCRHGLSVVPAAGPVPGGLSGDRLTGNGADDGDVDIAESAAVVIEALRPLITEIRSSLNYFASAHPDSRVKRLALVGGAALLPGLAEELTGQLGVPAYLSDPLQRVVEHNRAGELDALDRFRSSAAVSIGLTLGAA